MIISLHAYRHTRRIVEVLPVQYSDCRIEFARRVEQRLYEITEAVTEGRPSDTEPESMK